MHGNELHSGGWELRGWALWGRSEWRVLIEVRIEVRDLRGWREGVGGVVCTI